MTKEMTNQERVEHTAALMWATARGATTNIADRWKSFCHGPEGEKWRDAAREVLAVLPAQPAQPALAQAPVYPTGEMMDACRHLIHWLCFDRPTERSLLGHCKALGKKPPFGCRDVDHVPPARLQAFWIFTAMMAARPKPEDMTADQELRDIAERLQSWLTDHTENDFSEEDYVDQARNLILARIGDV